MVKALLSAITAISLGAASVATAGTYNGYETPKYSVENRDGEIELRNYAPFLAAEVRVSGSQNQAANRAFRKLGGFIFGNNVANGEIAMTAPVTQEQSTEIAMTAPVTQEQSNGLWTVRFMMPSEYTRDTLPTPTDDSISIVTVRPGKRLVVVFSGTTQPAVVEKRAEELRAYANATGLEIVGPVELARYNDPFTAPWNRRNEVSFPVQ